MGSTRILARWRLRLSEFPLDNVHYVGVRHQTADALSRLQTTCENETLPKGDLRLLAIDAESDYTRKLVSNANSNDITPLNAQTKTPTDAHPTLAKPIVK